MSFSGGSGTSADPYLIENWNHLDSVRDHLNSSFELISHLDENTDGYDDLAGDNANDGKGWNPIPTSFTGVFDSKGHVISDLIINRGDEDRIGLFKTIDGGEVRNLGIIGDTVGAGDSFEDGNGLLAGCMEGGSVEYVFVGGSVQGDWGNGGLIGSFIGGTVDDCYSLADVIGGDATGGLIGHAFNNPVASYCYSIGSVSGGRNTGGFGGWFRGSSEVHNSYYDQQSSGQEDAFGQEGGDVHDVTGLDTIEMTGSVAETNMNELDFINTWSTVENGYPILQNVDENQQLEAQGLPSAITEEHEIYLSLSDSYGITEFKYMFSGTVTKENEPIEDAIVYAVPHDLEYEVIKDITNELGEFEMEVLKDVKYTLFCISEGDVSNEVYPYMEGGHQ